MEFIPIKHLLEKCQLRNKKAINKIKTNIIKEKNNAIFFNKDVVSIFETLTNELKEESENELRLNATKLLVAIGTPESEIKENETNVNTLIPFTLKKYSAFLNATKN